MGRHTEGSDSCKTESKSASQSKNENFPSVSVLTSLNRSTILANVGKKNVNCLLDSGASISCISNSYLTNTSLHGTRLQPSDIPEIAGVGGERHKILGILETHITISKAKFKCKFYVIDRIQHPVILGIDFLTAHKVDIDFGSKLVYIEDNLVHTSLIQSNDGLARIVVPTEIPPNSQINVLVRVSRRKAGEQVLLEPSSTLNNRNLAGARCMVKLHKPDKTPRANMSIINPTENSVYLQADTVVATVHEADISEQQPLADEADNNSSSATCFNINLPSQEEPNINFDLSKSDLTGVQKEKLAAFLGENKDLFSPSLQNLGRTDLYHHVIETEPGKGPVRLPFYRQAPHIRNEIDRQVNEMLEQGIVEPSNSIWHSPVVLVKKKDGSYRFAVDYRQLNKITKPIAHPLPRLESVFDAIGAVNAQYFTSIDLASSYWQIPMDPATKHKSAFITHDGIYEFNRMAFGLKNAPMSFQFFISQQMHGLNWKHVLCYIDDILIFSKTFEDHLEHISQVFQRLKEAKLTLKPSKCHFAVPKVTYLGHNISKSGIELDPSNTNAVRTFPVPKNQRDVRSFLGLANFYRRFCKDFAKIATPLNKLLQKGITWKWTEEAQDAFEKLKECLITAPMLHYPDLNSSFCLTTDASDVSLGYILSQKDSNNKDRVVAYGGRSLRPDERKWTVTEKECLAVVEGIKAYREYLSHRPFTVYTDHKALQWLNNMKDPSNRLGRWALKLQEYQYTVVHKEGRKNGNADALSRRIYDNPNENTGKEAPQEQTPQVCAVNSHGESEIEETGRWLTEVTFEYTSAPSVSPVDLPPDTEENVQTDPGHSGHPSEEEQPQNQLEPDHSDLIALQKECPDFHVLYDYLAERKLPDDATLARNTTWESDQYMLADRVLYHYYQPRTKKANQSVGSIIQVALPKALRLDVLRSYHDSIAGGGHLGIQKTFEAIRQKFYWPHMYQDVQDYVLSCDVCQRVKVDRRQPRVPMTNMPITDTFDSWHIDFLGPLPRTEEGSYAFILLVVDRYSRWSEAFPMRDQDAKSVAKVLFNEIFARYGAPRVLVSDRGTQFMSRLVSALCEMFDVTRHHCSSYHAKTNSACERTNSTIAQTLRAYTDENQKNWADFLPAAMMALRSSPASGTGLSPFHLLFGKEMNLPIDTSLIPKTTLGLDAQNFFERLLKRLKAAKEIAGANIKISQEKSKQRHDLKAKDPDLKVGDNVLLKNLKVPKGLSPKLYPKTKGPFYITELGPNFTYKLRSCADHSEVKCLINASRLKKYVNPEPIRRELEQQQDNLPQDEQEEDENHQELIEVEEQQNAAAQANGREEPPVPARKPQNQPDEHVQDRKPVRFDRDPLKILKSRRVDNKRQYFVRYEQSWEPAENLKKIQEIFPCRVLRKVLTGGKLYCLVRWTDTWEPAEKCSNELIKKYNIARANSRRAKKTRPQPRHEYFLRSNQ